MMQNATPAQRKAIDTRQDTLVSAAAGSGKTAVMVERAVQIIAEGTDVRSLLMVTFTNAAAAQMKQRIRKALLEESNARGDARLRRQAALLRTADVCTLDSFCIRLCRKYFHLVDIDPMFSIAGTVESKLLRRAAMDELMDEAYTRCDPVFLDMLRALCGNREENLRSMIEKTYDYARTSPDPQAFLQMARERYLQPKAETYREIRSIQEEKQKQAADLFDTVAQILHGMDCPEWHDKLGKLIVAYSERAARLRGPATFAHLSETAKEKLPNFSVPAEFDQTMKETLQDILEEAKTLQKELASHEIFRGGEELYRERDRAMAPYVDCFITLVESFGVGLNEQKRAKGVLDFADCEQNALRILQNREIAQTLREQYAYVFVDEYQDTNDIQEAIVEQVARPGSLFCVGDVKQSIYRFRHAEPHIFLSRYHRYKQEEGSLCIDLNANFRSAKGVIDGVNAVFSRCMRQTCGGVDYDESQTLYAGRDALGTAPELHMILKDSGIEEDSDPGETLQSTEAEAAVCAQRIRELMEETLEENGTERPFTYDDIVILMRSVSGRGPAFVEALQSHGIPAAGNFSENGIPETVMPILFALRVIHNGQDDFSLLGVMRSVIGGFSAAELADIRLYAKQVSFCEAVRAYAGTDAKTEAFWNMIEGWRKQAFLKNALEIIEMVMDTSNVKAAYAAMRYGDTGLANLDKLCEKARSYCACTDGSLMGFLELLETDTEFKGSPAIPQQENGCVRVMSVHASKGLEFPAVILVGTGRSMRAMRSDDMRLDKEWGIGFPYLDIHQNVMADGGLYLIISEQMHREELSEEMRILYVALTRAKERLMVTAVGTGKQWEKSKRQRPECASRLLDWIAPASGWNVIRHGMPHAENNEMADEQQPLRTEAYQWVKQRMEWQYPYRDGVITPSKAAASQIGKTATVQSIRPPAFAEAAKLDGAARGTLTHKALLHLDLQKAGSPAAIDEQLDGMMQRGLFLPEERQAIGSRMLWNFTRSELCARVRRAQTVLRELPFNLLVRADEVGLQGQEELLVQGVLDMAFLEEDRWVVVDYKTDYDTDPTHLRELYTAQVSLYRKALASITPYPVKESILFLLRTGETLQID